MVRYANRTVPGPGGEELSPVRDARDHVAVALQNEFARALLPHANCRIDGGRHHERLPPEERSDVRQVPGHLTQLGE